MNAITTRSKSSPLVPTRAMDDLIGRLMGQMTPVSAVPGLYEISDACAPSAEARGALQGRADHLASGLTAAEPEAISRCITSLGVVLPSRSTNAEAAKMELALTVEALKAFPEWAVANVCRRYLDGRLGNGRYAPTPPELAKACRELIAPFQAEAAKIQRILNAQVYREPTEEERARVQAKVDELKRSFTSAPGDDDSEPNHPQNKAA